MIPWLWRAAWLLLPAAWLRFAHDDTLTFFISCLSLIPLAKAMGDATEDLSERLGAATGSLLNATFGNAAELILGITALRQGHVALVKGSLTGSILGNLLLVAGASIVTGGVRFSRLKFNRLAASSSVSTLFLAVVAMVVPTLLAASGGPRYNASLLSEEISAVLIAMYALSLASELLVDSLGGTLARLKLPETFVGVIIVAIVGNAAEHSTALIFARRGDMDVALGIAWESSKQIALLVAPVLVFVGILLGAPMDLAFTRFEVIALGLAVIALSLIVLDGETHWLEGAFLLAVYAVLGLGFFFIG